MKQQGVTRFEVFDQGRTMTLIDGSGDHHTVSSSFD